MILWLYTALGFFHVIASSDPAYFKPLLSWTMWAGNLGHGIVALIAVFTDSSASSVGKLSGWSASGWDKLFVAVPFWFALWLGNLFFALKVWDSYLLPWEVLPLPGGGLFAVPEQLPDEPDNKWLRYYSYFLKIVGNIYLGIFLVGYWCKFGLAWHDAGTPWDLTDVKFNAVRACAHCMVRGICKEDHNIKLDRERTESVNEQRAYGDSMQGKRIRRVSMSRERA